MYRAVKYLSVLLMALAPVCAHATICENVLSTEEAAPENVQRENPLTIPDDLNEIVSTDQLLLSVNTLTGKSYCYDASWVQSIENMELFEDGRFLGFHFYALEADGYILIDRAGNGAEIATGNKPYFTDDGKNFVALQVSGAGWGNLEGMAAWRVKKAGTERSFFTDDLLQDRPYKISHFHASGCGYVKTELQQDGFTVPSYIVFELGNNTLFPVNSDLEKCVSKKTGKSILEVRKARSAAQRGPVEWYAIHDGADPVDSGRPKNNYFADKGSIFGSGPYLSIATSQLSILGRPEIPLGMEITEYRKRSLIDCDTQKYKTLDYTEYGPDKKLVMSNEFTADSREWITARPDTAEMAMITFACKPIGNVGEQIWQGNYEPRQWLEAMAQADWSN